MGTLVYIELAAIIIIALLVMSASIARRIREKRIIPDCYELLAVLSDQEWKEIPQIRKEIAELKETNLALMIVHEYIADLENEGLVELQEEGKKRKYRLTYMGIDEKGRIAPSIVITQFS